MDRRQPARRPLEVPDVVRDVGGDPPGAGGLRRDRDAGRRRAERRRNVQRHLVVPDDRVEALPQVHERVEVPAQVVVDRQRRQRGAEQRQPAVVSEAIVLPRQVDRHAHRDRGLAVVQDRRVEDDGERRASSRERAGGAAVHVRDDDRPCAATLHAVRPQAEPDRGERIRLEVRERDGLAAAPRMAERVAAERDDVRGITRVTDHRDRGSRRRRCSAQPGDQERGRDGHRQQTSESHHGDRVYSRARGDLRAPAASVSRSSLPR